MKALATTFVLSVLFFGSPVMAGVGHDHGHSHAQASVDQKVAEENADAVIASFVEKGKIDKSWESIKVSSAEKKEFNERAEWVLIYINEEITDADKQKLYVFLTEAGEYIALNYTGN